MNIAGYERSLPICEVNEHLDIAGFVIFSDVELTIATSKALIEQPRPREYRSPMKWQGRPENSISSAARSRSSI